MSLTQQRLKEVLDYDPETGVFIWKASTSGREVVGSVAGAPNWAGYWRIGMDSHRYKAHRLAFLWMEGHFPDADVDHINGNRSDNRWQNLRPASRTINMQNTKRYLNNKSDFTGIAFEAKTKKWRAEIKANGKQRYLGVYDKFWQALATRKIAERKHGFHVNHARSE